MKNLIKYALLFFLLYASINQISAQSPFFKNYDILKGNQGYSVNTIFQDQAGYIWIGSSEGLFRYDGESFLHYTTENGLSSNNISFIGQNDSLLWIGYKNGKIDVVFPNMKIRNYPLINDQIDESISKIIFHPNQHIYIATTGNGLFDIFNGKITLFNSENKNFDDYIYDIELDKNNKLWLGSDIGILVLEPKDNSITKLSMSKGLPDNIVKDIEFENDSILWVGMEEAGIARYNINQQKFGIIKKWMFGSLNHFIIKKKNELWISTASSGVIKFNYKTPDNYQYKNYGKKNGLISNNIFYLFKDMENNVWIGGRGGLSLYTGNLFEFLDKREGLPTNHIVSFLIDEQGKYWVAGLNSLFIMEKSLTGDFQSKELFNDKKYKNHTFTYLYKDSLGFIWVGTYGFGVYRINPDNYEIKNYSTNDGLSNNNVLFINGSGDKVWFATLGGGASFCTIHDKKISFTSYDKDSQLSNNYIYSIFIAKNGDVWFAKDGGGASVLRNNKIWNFKQFDTLSNVVYSIAENKNSVLFTTPKNGIIQYNGKVFTQLTKKDGLLSNSYQSVINDKFGNFVLAANEGVTIFKGQNHTFENFGEEYGVAYREPGLNAIFKDKSENIWISTKEGIIKYNATEKNTDIDKIKILITKKQAFYHDIPDSLAELSYDQNYIVFNYIAFWYKAPEKLHYRYRLVNHDIGWNYAGKTLSATYSGLPPGNYIFQVQVSNENGVWKQGNTAEFSFKIIPPFWQTWWFIGIFSISILAGIFLFIRLRTKKLIKDKERLEIEVQKRTAEISEQKKQIEIQKEEIELKNKNITDSILYASRIQNAVLPPENIISEILPEYFILYKPRDIVSGDYYWVTKKGDEVVIAVADCTGHGVPGAFMSMLGVAFLNEIVNRLEKLTSADILNQLREQVKSSLRQNDKESNSKDGMDIALCVLNLKDKCLQYAGAYNPLFIINKNKFNQIRADRMPIGIYLKEKDSFTNHIVYLNSGDSIYMFSDGYIDQFGGKNGKKFLAKNFKKLIIEIQDLSMKEQKEVLNRTLEEWKGNREQVDDILVMGFRIP